MTLLLALRYEGEGEFRSQRKAACDREYVIGAIYTFERQETRSDKSHKHYFACVHDAWQNLPEKLADEFPSSESLRKFALIKTGYCRVSKIVCATANEAVKAAAFALDLDPYAIAEATEKVVTVYRAESQSYRSMGKERFQKSKDAVLQYVSELIGADAAQLGRAA